jgi:cation diffusion facilitator family transporter
VRRAGIPIPSAGVVGPDAHNPGRKTRAAGLSIISNSALIVLKVAAGVLTGSIALITEAIHSAVDLVASVVAFWSVRKADQPADEDHLYGHAKVENLAAALEGVLIVLGAAVIIFESVRRLADPPMLNSLGVGIAVIALSMVVNLGVSTWLYRQAHTHDSPALEGDAAHLRTDALTSVGVLIGLTLVQTTGVDVLDPIVALIVACAIIFSGVRIVSRSSRVLVDEALPAHELGEIRDAIESNGAPEIFGFHKLRARRAGSRRYIDMHVQFRRGTTLERAHALSHDLSEAIRLRIPSADVLIHLEPEDTALRDAPGRERGGGVSAG